ncbi:MAG: ABC transporter ATP-binding protein [Betaproteobacteria bacterium RIFCSPLOWO2_02_FULL_65_24]|nr:MAG: ABC transporter ATP-binding protein [Betaproteobacteria bacterium RIFCSPLOWO2_02_FULL_65_24]OGA73242.1 MAG: ABC transporter ATP-binding protein [Betaproteobacteria bacterium RIFCSPLOWO2_12_FULL_66_14]
MLKVAGLSKSFPTPEGMTKVIDGVDFAVPEGECYALLGPSGCGKTTTLRCVAGLEHADGGTIEIGGRAMSDPARGVFVAAHERPIGMVFQSYAIWPHLDVFENVAYPLRVQRPRLQKAEIQARVADALALVGMQAMAARSATRLSGGQQQRVALARALVRRPALLLLDEPLSNLDARLREQMRNELREMIHKVGVTALYVTHDQAEAFALAHRVAVMWHGRIVQEGEPRAIYRRPETPFVATFLGAANVLAARLETRCNATEGVLVLGGSATARLLVAVPQGCSPGDALELIVRPEDVEVLCAPPQDMHNVTPARIAWMSFQGSQCECGIDVGGAFVRAMVHSAQDMHEGAQVWLRLDPSRCILFSKEG